MCRDVRSVIKPSVMTRSVVTLSVLATAPACLLGCLLAVAAPASAADFPLTPPQAQVAPPRYVAPPSYYPPPQAEVDTAYPPLAYNYPPPPPPPIYYDYAPPPVVVVPRPYYWGPRYWGGPLRGPLVARGYGPYGEPFEPRGRFFERERFAEHERFSAWGRYRGW
jgi:hypothetical protein